MNKWADYLDGNNTITFYVQAKRSIQDKLSNSNFTATADAQKIEYNEITGTYRVPVTVTSNRNNNDISITNKPFTNIRICCSVRLLNLFPTAFG